ncbi:MAG TPA: hypothetical protein VM509_06705 [Planctomycetota bacterium]|nr:hypothetical protein [Planctomycetota bacterium]
MSQRSKNLLEAFNQSKAPEKSAQPVAQPRGSAPRVGGPFADQAPPVQPVQPRAEVRTEARQGLEDGTRVRVSRARVALLCGLIAVVSFFIGRISAPSVAAADGASATNAGVPPSAPAPGAPRVTPKSQSQRDALNDRANNFTVLGVTYDQNANNEKLAKAARESLGQQGLPAELVENKVKKQIYVLIGATPKLADLDALVAQVKQAKDSRGVKDFTSARGVPIDNYLKR